MGNGISRRDMMKAAGAVAAMAVVGAGPARAVASSEEQGPSRKRALRLAHLTDVHVQPERKAGEGLTACLRHVQSLRDRPSMILVGGDCVMDSFESDGARTQLQWDLWKKVWRDECSLPVRPCIGNHDIWGWNKAHAKTTGDEPNYGKKRAIENLDLAERFYSFDQSGWHFVVLDSTQPPPEGEEGYKAFVDEEQFDWLTRDLRDAGQTPTLVMSHIPILTTTAFLLAKDEKRNDWNVSGGLMHTDALRLKNLFAANPGVKLCLSGHTHLVDRVDYNGVTYLCNGAVCGSWWKGRNRECDEGYAAIDLYDDGSFEHEYITYGWKAQP